MKRFKSPGVMILTLASALSLSAAHASSVNYGLLPAKMTWCFSSVAATSVLWLRQRPQPARHSAHPDHAGDYERRAAQAAGHVRCDIGAYRRRQGHERRDCQGRGDAASDPSCVLLQQFKNPANPAIHESAAGPQVWNDTDGKVDIFVSGVGTGGTIAGVSRYIKRTQGKAITSVAVEAASHVLTQARAGEPFEGIFDVAGLPVETA